MKSECCKSEIEMNESGFHGWCTGCQSIIIFDRKGEIKNIKFAQEPLTQTTLFDIL